MPKNSAEASEMLAVLTVYNDHNNWMGNADFIEAMKKKLGEPYQEPQAYTKKTQIPAYFGFIEWETQSNQSNRRITDSGKRFLVGLQQNNEKVIFEEILHSLETKTFGRNALGVSSDSNVEPPQVFIKCALALGYLKRQEYGYILWKMDEGNPNILDLLSLIASNRIKGQHRYEIPNTYGDAKPITALVNWGFLVVNGSEGGQDKILINPNFLNTYIDRLNALKTTNNFGNADSSSQQNEVEELKDFGAKNVIYYGPPGTGKSFKVNSLISSKESRTQRVTFHPEYDYASFIGSYKPFMSESNEGGADISYEFVPQIFTKIYVDAWNDLANDYYLVIEEINRGNCSEIFGDIFQLLDRKNDYPVTPSRELKRYLEAALNQSQFITAEKLLLPPNLTIYATMNTSDQSLFPMDSAFKRRWDWEYVPIDYEKSASNPSSNFSVQLTEAESFDWIDFIRNVNQIIKGNDNLGMDKCIGNYFVKPEDGVIGLKPFVNKVLFYLWNDVFKDEPEDESIFKGKISYEDFFPIESAGVEKVREMLNSLGIQIKPSRD